MSDLTAIRDRLRTFADARNWNQFHTPKNLSMAIAGETGELLAEFQWLTPEESTKLTAEKLRDVEMEIADIAIYLVRLADVLGLDIYEATMAKIAINESRFPPQ
jgi:dCTP diphosphatase